MHPHRVLHLLAVVAALFLTPVIAGGGAPPASDRPSADQALQNLRVGNARFYTGANRAPNLTPERVRETAEHGQFPFATVLSCADSRVPVEHLFDAGVGDLFVVRVAGNVADTDEIGTIEYGVGHLGTPLLVIMGHTGCGAVTAVVEGAEVHGAIPMLVDNIVPAAEWVKQNRPELTGKELVNAAVEANVWQAIDDTLSRSEVTRGLVKSGQLKIVGAVYELATGRVRFMGEHPYQDRVVAAAESGPADPHAPATSTANHDAPIMEQFAPAHADAPARDDAPEEDAGHGGHSDDGGGNEPHD